MANSLLCHYFFLFRSILNRIRENRQLYLEFPYQNTDDHRIFGMELQASVRFIAVPEAHSLPDTIPVGTFLCREDLHSHSWKTAWPMETNARVNARDQELIRRKLCHQSDTMCVVGARRMASVVLRVAV